MAVLWYNLSMLKIKGGIAISAVAVFGAIAATVLCAMYGFGGSAPLNFKVVAYETEEQLNAATPKNNTIGVVPKVHLVAPKTITRSEGKAVRVKDQRKAY